MTELKPCDLFEQMLKNKKNGERVCVVFPRHHGEMAIKRYIERAKAEAITAWNRREGEK